MQSSETVARGMWRQWRTRRLARSTPAAEPCSGSQGHVAIMAGREDPCGALTQQQPGACGDNGGSGGSLQSPAPAARGMRRQWRVGWIPAEPCPSSQGHAATMASQVDPCRALPQQPGACGDNGGSAEPLPSRACASDNNGRGGRWTEGPLVSETEETFGGDAC